MGFDISNHAVDTTFIQGKLIPALMNGTNLDDYWAKAARLSLVSHHAKQQALRVMKLSWDVSERQRAATPEQIIRTPKKLSLLQKLMGKPAFEETKILSKSTGLPGFDSDLAVWGRPFFIIADNARESLDTLAKYLAANPNDSADVQRIVGDVLSTLERARNQLPKDLHPAALVVLDEAYPLADHLSADNDEAEPPDVAASAQYLGQLLAALQEAWHHRHTDKSIENDVFQEAAPANQLAAQIPYYLINLSSQLLPGWIGRGHVWPTALFEKIGVDVSHVFETPSALFADMVKAYPAIEENFSTTIYENWCLGGYVPPNKVSQLDALLKQHRKDLILAWSDEKSLSEEEVQAWSTDYIKIVEPVTLALENGYGFIEATEVYSGFLGITN
jgi:hypothetical protein